MKVSFTSCLALVALACLLPSGLAQNDAFEDCATTTFKIANNRVYVSADVFKYTKLTVGQGTMDCMALCRANDECWSFNFDKSKKWCYLISEEGSSTRNRRRQLWSSGYKVCVAHSDDAEWDNTPTDSITLEATALQATTNGNLEAGFVDFTWNAAVGTAGYDGAKTPTYRVICGHNDADWHCDETGSGEMLWASEKTTATELDDQDLTLMNLDLETEVKCFVETYVNNIKVACSDATQVQVGVLSSKIKVSTPSIGADVVVDFLGNAAYDFRVACYPGGEPDSCLNDSIPVTLGAWVEGAYPTASRAVIQTIAPGSYTCYLRYRYEVTGLSAGCSNKFIANVA